MPVPLDEIDLLVQYYIPVDVSQYNRILGLRDGRRRYLQFPGSQDYEVHDHDLTQVLVMHGGREMAENLAAKKR